MIALNSEIKEENNVFMYEEKWGWFWLEEVAWAFDGLSELGILVGLGKLTLDSEAGMARTCRVLLNEDLNLLYTEQSL